MCTCAHPESTGYCLLGIDIWCTLHNIHLNIICLHPIYLSFISAGIELGLYTTSTDVRSNIFRWSGHWARNGRSTNIIW